MDLFAYETHLSEKEKAILMDLLKYRVMTTEMIEKRYFPKKSNYINVLLHRMRKNGFIKSSILKKSRKGRKGYAYHMITETGKECLIRHDLSVEGLGKTIYVHEYQVANLLLANEALLEYESMGWQVWDSRKVKTTYNLDYRSNIQGLLISPKGKEYGLYTLETRVTENVVGKIQQEISRNKEQIKNYMILAKGADSYKLFIEYGIKENEQNNKKALTTLGELIIEPFNINFVKRKTFRDEKEWIYRVCKKLNIKIKSMEMKETRQSFPVIVEYAGEEMYLVDVTDSDLNKYRDIQLYNKSISNRSWEKGRRLLVITLGIDTVANLMLDNNQELPYVEHITIGGGMIQEICQESKKDTDIVNK